MSPLMTPLISPLISSLWKGPGRQRPKIAFPHTEFNGDRTKKGTIFNSFIYSFMSPLMTPCISPLISSLWKGLGRQRPTKMHFHIQNLTVIEPKKGYYFFIPLYLPLCRPLWLPLFIPLFLPCEMALAVRNKKMHFHIQNLTVIEPKQGTNFSFLYIFPYVAPYDSLYFSPYFFPVKWPWPSETKKSISTYRI